MAATNPARLRVIQSVAEALRGINGQGAYHYRIAPGSVVTEPINLLSVPETEVPALVVAEDTRGVRDWLHARHVRETVALLITVRVDARDEDGPDRKVIAASRIEADIERAVMADLTRGGVAFLTLVQPPEPMLTGVGPMNVVLLNIPVDVQLLRRVGES
jgi:hypothetical protein